MATRNTLRTALAVAVMFPTPLLEACENSPVASEPQSIIVEGPTARSDGLQASILKYNFSWYPRDDTTPFPGTEEVFTTFLIEVQNTTSSNRSFSDDQFGLRLLKFLHPHEGPILMVSPDGREPRLSGKSLIPGETVEGWLTFRVPRDSTEDELLWQPTGNAVYAIQIPPISKVFRYVTASVFGRVTDSFGNPVEGLRIVITPLIVPAIPGIESTVGDCTGTPGSPLETETDEAGWYQELFNVAGFAGSYLCVDVQAFPPETSNLESVRSAGLVPPAPPLPLTEPPEVRVDLVLRQVGTP